MTRYSDQQSQSGTLLDSDGKHKAGEERERDEHLHVCLAIEIPASFVAERLICLT